MIILFLDVDGVLNNRDAFITNKGRGGKILDDACIARLASLLEACKPRKVKVVLSSTWRLYDGHVAILRTRLRKFGVRIHSKTDDQGPTRGDEICRWLDANKPKLSEKRNFLILDDDSDMLPEQLPFFVQTSMKTGLTDEHIRKAAEILKIQVDESGL